MKQIVLILSLTCLASAAKSQTVSSEDFKPIEGEWKGKLTYLDYTSNKQDTIDAWLTAKLRGKAVDFSIGYPGESGKGGKDRYEIKDNGTKINGMKIIDRTTTGDGMLKLVLEEKGKDGNDHKPATFHYELIIGETTFIMTKLVKFEGSDQFFQRNQYRFNR
ncbi:MAG TPA: hypothetical protein PKG90_13450 [Chitinophagaceae bacterium]|nr:hypothetical protein [Chitinophagaceae bacterium]HNU13994.1 hypothetical protein [Chitinophagaceae bacterium]